ncbi:MAG: pantoate--beta-alanine ligase [Cocleimonas sp.]|nr:pantoate--beta-alanine ligase [Cocleimonas sp.]
MIKVSDIGSLQDQLNIWRQHGKRIAFVPTMGNLHKGHIELVKLAQQQADKVIVSIFVNPIQFDKIEDLAAYPSSLIDDKEQLIQVGCDLLFIPSANDIYPDSVSITRVEVPVLSEMLEGCSRKGHFSGVATVVNKLFNMVMPDIAIFGEKDYQQLMVIRKMVNDLNIPIVIKGLPTVRESDGLAMSSRNSYLTPKERQTAPLLYCSLKTVVAGLEQGDKNFERLQGDAKAILNANGFNTDYIEIRRGNDLQVASSNDFSLVVLGSAWLGKARLIDNIPLVLRA